MMRGAVTVVAAVLAWFFGGAATAGSDTLPQGLKMTITGVTVKSADEIELRCEIVNASDAPVRMEGPWRKVETTDTTTTAEDGQTVIHKTSRTERVDTNDNWLVTFNYQEGNGGVQLSMGVLEVEGLQDPLAAQSKREIRLRLPGQGTFTPGFFASVNSFRVSYTMSESAQDELTTALARGAAVNPARALSVLAGGGELRIMIKASEAK